MAQIPLLYPGCTAEDIIGTINALIAAITSGAGRDIYYKELLGKPTLNGIEIDGDQTTEDLKIKIAETADFDYYEEAWATKNYVDDVEDAAVNAAQAAANAALAGKLDKNLSNLEIVTHMGNGAYIPIMTQSGMVKVSTEDLAAYIGIKSRVENSSIETAIKSQRETMGGNTSTTDGITTYTLSQPYTLGTSAVYLNGNRLYAGRDYIEVNAYTIELIGWTLGSNDHILFEAIPLSASNPNQTVQSGNNVLQ